MKVLVIGANGNTGKRVIKLLTQGPHDPVAMIRDPSQRAFFDQTGVPTVLADLEYPVDHAVRDHDAVIFAAGSGSKTGKDKTVLVDQLGAIRSMVAAQVHGVQRYIMLSAVNSDINSTSRVAHYHKAKAHADLHLRETDLDWTIVCPAGLFDDLGTETVNITRELEGQGTTSRDNLATVLVGCLEYPNTIKKSFALYEGDTPWDEALRSV